MVQDACQLLTENLGLVERAVRFACRRYRLKPEDADEFLSTVYLRLFENDCAILAAWERRSGLATYFSIVVQRMALDYQIHRWGKWHTSAEATRLGPLAVELEKFLFRDGRTLEDAEALLASKHEGVTRSSLQALVDHLPERSPRPRDVPIPDVDPIAVNATKDVEEKILDSERRDTAGRLSKLLLKAFERIPDEERSILQLRFEQGLSVAQISRMLQIDQKKLYRRIDGLMRLIRAGIEQSGLAATDVLDLIGNAEAFLSFDIGKEKPRPSKECDEDEKEAAQSEEPR